MIRLQVATLCDTANSRDGLASLLSAGITLLRRPAFPATIGATLVVVVEISDDQPGTQHEIHIAIRERVSGETLLQVEAELASAPHAELAPDGTVATATVPFILNLGGVLAPAAGAYEAVVQSEGVEIGGARFDLIYDPSAQSVVQPVSTSQRP